MEFYSHLKKEQVGPVDPYLLDSISIEGFIHQCLCNIKHLTEENIEKEIQDLLQYRIDEFKTMWQEEKENIVNECLFLRDLH